MQTVKIRLRKPTRVFTFLSEDVNLSRGDTCIVRSDRGLEYGICILPPEACPVGMEKRFKMKVVRRATEEDEATHLSIIEDEKTAKQSCKERIQTRKLPMKLVDAEFTFDKQKLIFYFTADDRVDFRQLVRDLAQEFKTRIELRHIQVRDEAKLLGGIGICGRELCCSTWLREFKPISMKMAKRQNLSLNPSKISGQCGRLLCCLAYENDMYQRERRRSKPIFGADDMDQAAGLEVAAARFGEEGDLDDLEDPIVAVHDNDEVDMGIEEAVIDEELVTSIVVADVGEEFVDDAIPPTIPPTGGPVEGKPQTEAKPEGQPQGRRRRRGARRGGRRGGGGNRPAQ